MIFRLSGNVVCLMDRLIIYVIGRKIWNVLTEAKNGWSLSTPNDFLPSRLSRITKTSISRINIKRYLHPVDFKKGPKWRFDLGNLEASRLGMLQKYLFITLEIEFGCKYSLSLIWSLSIWEEGRLLLIICLYYPTFSLWW